MYSASLCMYNVIAIEKEFLLLQHDTEVIKHELESVREQSESRLQQIMKLKLNFEEQNSKFIVTALFLI